jgi:hypothetical protein
MMKPRHQKLLEELPKNGYKVAPSAIKAGYSPMYADKNPRQIIQTALKAQAREILETVDTKETKAAKQELATIIGMNREEVFKRLRYIANQDKDLSSALKVLAPLSKDLGVNLNTEEAPKTIVPILNIGIAPADNGSTELDISEYN